MAWVRFQTSGMNIHKAASRQLSTEELQPIWESSCPPEWANASSLSGYSQSYFGYERLSMGAVPSHGGPAPNQDDRAGNIAAGTPRSIITMNPETRVGINRFRVGLPFPSAECWILEGALTGGPGVRRRHAFEAGSLLGRSGGWLPLHPVWLGLVANACFYGVILWSVSVVPGVIKRARRLRRGACVRCGYDLRGSAPGAPCPECGNA